MNTDSPSLAASLSSRDIATRPTEPLQEHGDEDSPSRARLTRAILPSPGNLLAPGAPQAQQPVHALLLGVASFPLADLREVLQVREHRQRSGRPHTHGPPRAPHPRELPPCSGPWAASSRSCSHCERTRAGVRTDRPPPTTGPHHSSLRPEGPTRASPRSPAPAQPDTQSPPRPHPAPAAQSQAPTADVREHSQGGQQRLPLRLPHCCQFLLAARARARRPALGVPGEVAALLPAAYGRHQRVACGRRCREPSARPGGRPPCPPRPPRPRTQVVLPLLVSLHVLPVELVLPAAHASATGTEHGAREAVAWGLRPATRNPGPSVPTTVGPRPDPAFASRAVTSPGAHPASPRAPAQRTAPALCSRASPPSRLWAPAHCAYPAQRGNASELDV